MLLESLRGKEVLLAVQKDCMSTCMFRLVILHVDITAAGGVATLAGDSSPEK